MLQPELKKLFDMDIKELETDTEARHEKEDELLHVADEIIGKDITEDELLTMDVDAMEGLTVGQKNELHIIQTSARELVMQDLNDMENDPQVRHEKEEEIDKEVDEIIGEHISPEDFLNLNIISMNIPAGSKRKLDLLQEKAKVLHDQDEKEKEQDPEQR